LAEARDAVSAKQVADLAHAAEIYAKRQKFSDEAIDSARAVKVDALRLLGEFLQRAEKNLGARGNPGGQGAKIVQSQNGTAQPTLGSAGIGKKESAQSQQLARLAKAKPAVFEEVRNG